MGNVFIPRLPVFLCASRAVRDSKFVQSVLIVDEKRCKPMFSWYNPNESTWVPAGWIKETEKALRYYFSQ